MGILVPADSSSRSTPARTGDVLDGRYRIVGTLGGGSMGTVYLAEHVLVRRQVAIKILRPDLGDAAALDAFMTEARAAGTLGHPNIVECTDMGFTGSGAPYLVLEYLEGAVLTDEIYRLGGLPIRRALKIAEQIASALRVAHEAGIVHRALTSDNVFLIDKNHSLDVPKVLDFGVACCFTARTTTQINAPTGTPEFMAPEQLLSPDTVDERADVYALGVILYEMLTARRPFSDDDRRALMRRVTSEPPPPLQLPDAPPELEDLIVSRLLAKDPAQRPASMKDVQTALDALSAAARPTGPVSGEMSSEIEAARSSDDLLPAVSLPVMAEPVALPALPARRTPRLLWLVAALLAAAAGAGAMYLETQARTAAEQAVSAAIDTDAEKLAGLIDAEARSAQLRANGIAAMPMLRAAIETDAATLHDMAGSDFIFTPMPGEVFELFQLRDHGAPVSMLRIPEAGPPIPAVLGNQTRIVRDGSKITIIAGAPVARQRTGIGGAVAIAVPIDLAPLQKRIAEHARSAALVGLGAPLPLVGAAADAPTVTIPLPLASDLQASPLALAAVLPRPGARPELRIVGLGGWAVAGLLLALFAVNLLRGRKSE
ncbi:MAG TPA: serine/threonine-protein kinase [Kofleriaceae bacterium]|nr:serine/threonine-protein kinase [Kofleriaceae bacterium]